MIRHTLASTAMQSGIKNARVATVLANAVKPDEVYPALTG